MSREGKIGVCFMIFWHGCSFYQRKICHRTGTRFAQRIMSSKNSLCSIKFCLLFVFQPVFRLSFRPFLSLRSWLHILLIAWAIQVQPALGMIRSGLGLKSKNGKVTDFCVMWTEFTKRYLSQRSRVQFPSLIIFYYIRVDLIVAKWQS